MRKIISKIAGTLLGLSLSLAAVVAIGKGEKAQKILATNYNELVTYSIVNTKNSSAVTDSSTIMGWLNIDSGTAALASVNGTPSRVYPGANGGSGSNTWESGNLIKIGASSSGGSLTFNVSSGKSISKVSLTGYGWKAALVVTVNGTSCAAGAFNLANKTNVGAGNTSTVDFELSTAATSTLAISTNSTALCIISMKLYEAVASGKTPLNQPTLTRNGNVISWSADAHADHYEISVNGGSWSNTDSNSQHTLTTSPSSFYDVQVKAVASVSDETYEDSSAGTLSFNTLIGAGTLASPYTVADARAVIDKGNDLTGKYAIGIVSAIPTAYSTQHSNITFNMVDKTGDSTFLQAYRCKGTDAANVSIGDTAVVSGNLTKYSSTYEFAEGCTLETLTHPTVETTYNVTFNSNGGTDPDAKEIGEGLTFQFPSPGTKANYVFKGWTSGNNLYYQEGNTSPAVNGDIVYEAEWQTKGLESTPYTVAEALSAISTNTGIVGVCTRGIVTEDTISINSGKLTYFISDDGTTTNKLEVFKGLGLNGASFTAVTDLSAGDTVVVYGNMKDYNGTKEYDSNSQLKLHESPVAQTYTIQYDANGGTGTMTDTVGASPAVASCSFTAPTGMSFDKWNDASDGTGTDYAVGQVVSADIKLYAIWSSEAADPSVYFTKITNTSQISNGKYVITYGNLIFDGSLTTLDVASNTKTMDLSNLLTSYFTISDGDVKSASGKYIGRTSDSNGFNQSDTDDFTNTVTIDENENLVVASSVGAILRYNKTSGQERFRFYKSTSASGQQAIQLYRVNFDKVFEDAITCNESEGSHVFNMGIVWKNDGSGTNLSLESLYNCLSTTDKANLSSATIAKYDYIVGKYFVAQQLNTYNDFMGRNPSPVGLVRTSFEGIGNSNSSTIIIVVVALTSITSIGVLLVIKRKRSLVK